MRRAAFLILLAVLVSCDRENNANKDVSQNSPSHSSERSANPGPPTGDNQPTMNPAAAPQNDMPSSRIGGATQSQQLVELTEYEIRLPETLKAGQYSFDVRNSGKENHSLIIEGPGTHIALQEALTRGNEATMQVSLKPGTYTLYCPVDGHKGKGMTRTLTVQ